jgi:hypothetical protein
MPPFNAEHAWYGATTQECRVYNGCTIDNLTISGAKNEPIKTSVDYIAAYVYTAGAAKEALTEVTTAPYMWHESIINLDLANAGVYTAGTELINLADWYVKISLDLIAEGRCKSTGGNAISRPQATIRKYELGFTWDKDEAAPNDDLYDLAQAATDMAWQLYIYRGASDYLKLTVENAQVQITKDDLDAAGKLVPEKVTISGGLLDTAAGNNQCMDTYAASTVWPANS